MNDVEKAVLERFKNIHPLLKHRSLERSQTNGELFDMLDTMPEPPLRWNAQEKCWEHTDDLLQRDKLRGLKDVD